MCHLNALAERKGEGEVTTNHVSATDADGCADADEEVVRSSHYGV